MSTDLFYTVEHETVEKADCYLVCYLIYWSPSPFLPTQNPIGITLFYVQICLL